MSEPPPAADISSYKMETVRDAPPGLWVFWVAVLLVEAVGLIFLAVKLWL